MLFRRWYRFNEPVIEDTWCFICVVKENEKDKIMSDTLMTIENAVEIFGIFELIRVGQGYDKDSGYHALRFVLRKSEESD